MIIVTGASQGIGSAVASRLSASGSKVVVTSRSREKLEAVFGNDSNCLVIPWDLSDPDSIKAYSKEVKEQAGEITGLVHAAGIQSTLPVGMIKPEKIDEVFRINTYAAMLLVSAFSKKGMTAEGSSYVLISSLAAHEGAVGKTVYAASKAALEGFVRTAAPELSAKGIRINAIAPGVVRTPMVEEYFTQLSEEQKTDLLDEYLLGIGAPEDIANHAEFLLSDKSRWMTGQTYIIDGGHISRRC